MFTRLFSRCIEPLNCKDHSLLLREGLVTLEVQHDLDNLGIAKNAGEEKIRARDAKLKQSQEYARMAKLYREHVLKEPAGPELVRLAPAPKAKAAVEEREEVGSFGD